jgi:hypothetical protein
VQCESIIWGSVFGVRRCIVLFCANSNLLFVLFLSVVSWNGNSTSSLPIRAFKSPTTSRTSCIRTASIAFLRSLLSWQTIVSSSVLVGEYATMAVVAGLPQNSNIYYSLLIDCILEDYYFTFWL